MRARPRCEKYVMGPMRMVAMTSGQKPKLPALMGRNKIPAPTAVPKSEMAHSVLVAWWALSDAWWASESAAASLALVLFTFSADDEVTVCLWLSVYVFESSVKIG